MALKQKCNNPFVDYRNSGTGFHVLNCQYPACPLGPANSQMIKPRNGSTKTSTIQKTFDPVETGL